MTLASQAVKFEQLMKAFPSYSGEEQVYAVNNVSLDIEPGELVTLLGPSGCGKTTTLRMLAGFEQPTSGNIYIGNQNITNLAPNKRNVAMVFQSYALFPHLTVYENVAYGLHIQKLSKSTIKEKVQKVLDLMHLESMQDRMPSQLSGGQQQRVALARAVVTEPKVLLFDEPLSNLDAKLREYMRDELRKIQQRLGITSLYVTHDQAEAMAISDKVVIMNKGSIQQVGSPHDIYTKPNDQFVADFMGKANFIPVQVLETSSESIQVKLLGQNVAVPQQSEHGIPQQSEHVVQRQSEHVFSAGDQAHCVIRPEFWQFASEGSFAGTVLRATYLGLYVEYEIGINDQTVTMIDYRHHDHGIHQVGEIVRLDLKKEQIRVLPANDQG